VRRDLALIFNTLLFLSFLIGCQHQVIAQAQSDYIAVELEFAPYSQQRQRIEKKLKLQLKHRGEAHITVITPPEIQKLAQSISINEIKELAQKNGLQNSKFTSICVGQGQKLIDDKTESTYFVVIDSPELFTFRQKIQDLFIKRGGNLQNFNALAYAPHITLGFTKKDLHVQDGVNKTRQSCMQ
jgi:2'-5' RNA ligase